MPVATIKKIRVETEEDVFVRSGLFKRNIIQLYRNTCSFTSMRLQSMYGHHFIDARHIIPFSVTHDDRVANSIALCPNLHRAFDRGLVSISPDYRIMVSDFFREDDAHPYSLRRLDGERLILPENKRYYPAKESLEWHREQIFKQ